MKHFISFAIIAAGVGVLSCLIFHAETTSRNLPTALPSIGLVRP